MVNFVSKFIHIVNVLGFLLRSLLKDYVEFNWLREHENAFKLTKDFLSSFNCFESV